MGVNSGLVQDCGKQVAACMHNTECQLHSEFARLFVTCACVFVSLCIPVPLLSLSRLPRYVVTAHPSPRWFLPLTVTNLQKQDKNKERKLKLLDPDIFWCCRGLPREGAGAKKFGMFLKTQ